MKFDFSRYTAALPSYVAFFEGVLYWLSGNKGEVQYVSIPFFPLMDSVSNGIKICVQGLPVLSLTVF
jgi:hypothetical protein